MLAGDERAHLGLRVAARPDHDRRQAAGDGVDEKIAGGANRNNDADRHATFAGRAVGRGHRGVGRHLQVGVG